MPHAASGSPLTLPLHALPILAGSQLTSPSSPSAAYRLQKTWLAHMPTTTAARVPASDFLAPKRVPANGRRGV